MEITLNIVIVYTPYGLNRVLKSLHFSCTIFYVYISLIQIKTIVFHSVQLRKKQGLTECFINDKRLY